MTITMGISMEWIGSSRIILSIIRLYFYACVSLFVGFVLPLLFEPLKMTSSSILNVLVANELSFGLNALAYGIVVATLFTFAWNFLLGAGLQIISGLFGSEIPKVMLVGRAALIGFIYGGSLESIARALNYNAVSYVGLTIVLFTEFLAYSIATYGGTNVGKVLVTPGNFTTSQKIVNVLKGPPFSLYRKMKNDLKTELRASLKLCPIIAVLLLFAASLEIWLVLG